MRIKANAKINLTLDITGVLDNGYHLIDSVFQSVGVCDYVSVDRDGEISVFCEGLSGEKNIAFTAAKEFFAFTGKAGGAKISIEKQIPLCAGLGGGSADAAAVITALNKLYSTDLSVGQMAEIGLKCGADVPFFLYGGTARVRGIGEKVTPMSFIGDYFALIVKADVKESTAAMYKKLDGVKTQKKSTVEFIRLIGEGKTEAALKTADNAFSAVCETGDLIDLLAAKNPLCASLSGSGPACFALFKEKTAALSAARALESRKLSPIIAPFADCGTEICE